MTMTTRDPITYPELGLREYIEVRFNLLIVASDKTEAALRERIDAVEAAAEAKTDSLSTSRELAFKSIHDRFVYVEQLSKQVEESIKQSTVIAAETQKQHNLSQNEWRATLTDFTKNTPTRPEFDKLTGEMTALRLELSTKFSMQQGERAGTKDVLQEHRAVKDDSRAGMAIVIAAATGVVASILSLVAIVVSLRAPTPAPVYVPQPPTQQAPR